MSELNTILPDTNVVLRYLLRDHEQLHQQANAVFEKIRIGKKRAIILESVLTECVYVLTKFYEVPREETAEKLKKILLYKGIKNKDKDVLMDALDLYSEKELDVVDCLLIKHSERPGFESFSFDRDVSGR